MQQCHHSYVGYSSFICQSFYSRSFTVVTLGAALTLCLLSTVQNSIAETAVNSAIVFSEKFKPKRVREVAFKFTELFLLHNCTFVRWEGFTHLKAEYFKILQEFFHLCTPTTLCSKTWHICYTAKWATTKTHSVCPLYAQIHTRIRTHTHTLSLFRAQISPKGCCPPNRKRSVSDNPRHRKWLH